MEDAIHGVPGHSEVQLGSARSFGLWFSAIFTIAGLLPLRTGGAVRLWAIGVGCAFLVLALAVPAVLQPLNVVWGKFGLLLGRVMNPIVLGISGIRAMPAWVRRTSRCRFSGKPVA